MLPSFLMGRAWVSVREVTEEAPAVLSVDGWEALWRRCWRYIRTWQLPPHWSAVDWHEEAYAAGALAAWQAMHDFDPARGVPRNVFLFRRVLAAVWTRYRQERSFSRHTDADWPLEECLSPSGMVSRSADIDELFHILDRLPDPDRWLLDELFWEGRSETELAHLLGVTPQAISRRKAHILKALQRSTADLGKSPEFWL